MMAPSSDNALPCALITGITGQDGYYLAHFLLERGYVVHGVQRYSAHAQSNHLGTLLSHPAFHLHDGDLSDTGSLYRLLSQIRPTELYNLAAISHVGVSFTTPEVTGDIDALGTLRLLDAIRNLDLVAQTRFYQAGSSEMFGNAPAPQNEDTPMTPCSPYAAAKLYAHHLVRIYRESYGLHASNGILFNHESPLRGEQFVTRKISRGVAEIEAGLRDHLTLGNLDARRDWGCARDYVLGMWLMLQQERADDYVLATGTSHAVRDFVHLAFARIGITMTWKGAGADEYGVCDKTGRILVRVDRALFRPAELHHLCGDATKARTRLNWEPVTGFTALVHEMVDDDRAKLRKVCHDAA